MLVEISLSLVGILGLAFWWRLRVGKAVVEQELTAELSNSSPSLAAQAKPAPSSQEAVKGVGDRIGAYQLEEHLGEGGMAQVYRATKLGADERSYALKFIKSEFAKDEQFRKRFRREIKLCQVLKHPNIVALEDWGEEGDCLFLVLEYVEGQDLDERISPDGLELSEILLYLEGLVCGLSYAHDRGVVHRDLKPGNVMINHLGEIKIMDFGLARGGGDKVTKTGNSMGSPAYIPPEQITGAEPTPAADQYSLGIILYELLTGHRPFREKNPLKLLMQQLSETPPDPTTFKSDLHPNCAAIVLRMLEKSPEDRFSSLHSVKEGLRAVEQGQEWVLPARPRPTEKITASDVEISLSEQTDHDDDTMDFQVSS